MLEIKNLRARVGGKESAVVTGPAGEGRCVTVTVTGGAISSIVPETY